MQCYKIELVDISGIPFAVVYIALVLVCDCVFYLASTVVGSDDEVNNARFHTLA